MLIGMIESNLTNMFTDVNEKVGTIAREVGRTPSTWNGSIYSMIRGLSESVIVPIAGIIITFVLCYELISMITEKKQYARHGHLDVLQVVLQSGCCNLPRDQYL